MSMSRLALEPCRITRQTSVDSSLGGPRLPARHYLSAYQVHRRVLTLEPSCTPSEPRVLDEIDYTLLCRWFVGRTPSMAAHVSLGGSRNPHPSSLLPLASKPAATVGCILAKLKAGWVLTDPHRIVNRPLLDAWSAQGWIPDLND